MSALAKRYSERADAYDRLWSPAILPVASRLLERLQLAGAADVIDIGTGAGALLPAIRQAAPQARILGVDSAEGMLQLAQRRHIGELALMNVEELDLPSARYDATVIAFVLFHLPHPYRCVAEAFRVLKPGGRIGTATWGLEHYPAVNAIWDEELTKAGAETFPLPATDNRACCDSESKVADLLGGAGFASISTWTEPLTHRWRPEDHFEYQVLATSRSRLESLAADKREEGLQRIRARLAGATEDKYIYSGDVVLATAYKAVGEADSSRYRTAYVSPMGSTQRARHAGGSQGSAT